MTDPILRDFPEQFESERLLIRAPFPGDGAEIHAAIAESLDELRPWMPWAHLDQSVEDVEANVRQARAEFLARHDLRLHVYLRDGGGFVGSSGLHRNRLGRAAVRDRLLDPDEHDGTRLRDRGDASHRRLRVRRSRRRAGGDLVRCPQRAQRRCGQRAGFELEARLRHNRLGADGQLTDSLCFARLRNPQDMTPILAES